MMLRAVPISTLAFLLLCACDRDGDPGAAQPSPSDRSGPAANASAAALEDVRFEPGQWSATVRIEHVSAPRMPPQMADDMKRMFADVGPVATCLTAAEAKKPAADFFLGRNRNNCAYDQFAMSNGVIDARLSCTRDNVRQTMALQGSYTANSYNLLATTKTQGADRPELGPLTMKMVIVAKRTGQCDGNEPKF